MKNFMLFALLLIGTTAFAKGYERNVMIESMNTEKDGNIYTYSYWLDASGNHLDVKGSQLMKGAVAQVQYRLILATKEIEQELTRNAEVTISGSLLNKEQNGLYIIETILVRETTKN